MSEGRDILIGDLLDLPEKVFRGDFVLDLIKGVGDPETTVRDYVVTTKLAECFDDALSFIHDAVDTKRSKAAYLHGSFGSGKSHFMAMLCLLLGHNVSVRSKKGLEAVCIKHDWVKDRKFLLVPYHMIGKSSLRSAILGGYATHVRGLHPDAPLPGVYLDEDLFQNAGKLRGQMGDDKFFEILGASAAGSKWGALGGGWNRQTFEAATAAAPGSADRARLVSDLIERFFPAFRDIATANDGAFVELDVGLEVMSRHARSLGYDAVVLFLDELILWLASHAGDVAFVEREGPSLVKLVEAQKAGWPAPIVSFIARQRDLRELVGTSLTGAERLNFADILQYWEDRFHKIEFVDSNLNAVAEQRVLRPKDDAARAQIDQAFRETQKIHEEILQILLTSDASRETFRQVYPFSPAFVRALVAISSALQRERTALRILFEILVDRRASLKLGEVVPVGDLWDQVARDDAAFSDAMRIPFQNAKRLYVRKLRPLLEEAHGVDVARDTERAAGDPAVAEKLRRFQNDDRLVKTLLIASIAREEPTLKGLTCRKLAALNHGTIRAPLPGREGQVVLTKLKAWADRVSEIKFSGDAADPTVELELSSVDTDTIIEAARTYDSPGARRRKLKEILFGAMGITDPEDVTQMHVRSFLWRNTRRSADVLFGNVREMALESLTQKGEDWKIVIDFPFDQEGYSARHDEERVNAYLSERGASSTLVWLPSFLSMKTQQDLGKLVVLEHLLKSDNALAMHSEYLSNSDRQTAKGLLQNQESNLRGSIAKVLEAAYGIREPASDGLDPSEALVEGHFRSLNRGFRPRPPAAGANLGAALDDLLRQALDWAYPRHPVFDREVRVGDLKKVLDVVREAAGASPPRVLVDKLQRPILKQIANPLKLGRMSDDGYFVLEMEWRDRFNRKLHQANVQNPTVQNPTVGNLRSWIDDDPKERFGLTEEVQNLLILSFAELTNRALVLHGGPVEGTIDRIPDDVILRQERLPAESVWAEATIRAHKVFGVVPVRHVTAAQVGRLCAAVEAILKEHRTDCARLPEVLKASLKRMAVPPEEIAKAPRLLTAKATKELSEALLSRDRTERIEALAAADLRTSAEAVGTSLKNAKEVCAALEGTKWHLLEALLRIPEDRGPEARIILDGVTEALRGDEYAVRLGPRLEEAEESTTRLLAPAADGGKPPARKGWKPVGSVTKRALDASSYQEASQEIEARLGADPALRVDVSWTLLKEKDSQ